MSRASRITIVRETQSLRKTVQLPDNAQRDSNVNPSIKNSFDADEENI
jgi:hypothetical protein